MLTRVGGYCLRMTPDGEVQEHQQDEDAGIAYPLSPGLFFLVAFVEFHLTVAVKVNAGGNFLRLQSEDFRLDTFHLFLEEHVVPVLGTIGRNLTHDGQLGQCLTVTSLGIEEADGIGLDSLIRRLPPIRKRMGIVCAEGGTGIELIDVVPFYV